MPSEVKLLVAQEERIAFVLNRDESKLVFDMSFAEKLRIQMSLILFLLKFCTFLERSVQKGFKLILNFSKDFSPSLHYHSMRIFQFVSVM